MSPSRVVVTCEHASNALPAAFEGLAPANVLASHRGWDAGALPLAQALASRLDAPLHAGRFSRLLVDLNRSSHHPGLFSSYARPLVAATRTEILETIYQPFRSAVWGAVTERLPCLHLSVHSFTPEWEGQRRTTDIGLLYDPGRNGERRLAAAIGQQLRAAGPWTVHRNQPYRGRADGHTTALRRQLADGVYAGLEIEINQRWVDTPGWPSLQAALAQALAQALKDYSLAR